MSKEKMSVSQNKKWKEKIRDTDKGRERTAIGFIGMICAISMAITSPTERDTNGICAPELSFMTGREVTILFIRVVPTVIPMVTLLRLINTPSTRVTSKLVQLTCCCICSNSDKIELLPFHSSLPVSSLSAKDTLFQRFFTLPKIHSFNASLSTKDTLFQRFLTLPKIHSFKLCLHNLLFLI